MTNPFIGQISQVGFGFAPRSWAFCNGQLLPINDNTALFSLIGTIYGGDGRTTFALPNLQGRVMMHAGSGPGLTPRSIGQRGGIFSTTLSVSNIPSHTHTLRAKDAVGAATSPENAVSAQTGAGRRNRDFEYKVVTPNTSMRSDAIASTGNGQSFSIRNPYLGIYAVIALVGTYPSRA